jgi:hyperosmotically inducible protein
MKTLKKFGIASFVAASTMVLAVPFLTAEASVPGKAQRPLSEQVRHEIVMQPFLTVFDNISYKVEGDTVTLEGQVVLPVLKYDAANSVKRIAGVSKVVNNIKVLPLSPMDDRIRRAEFRTIYNGSSPLSRYNWGAIPSIHIIVENGHVTLEGVVDRQSDKDMATLVANGVPGVFSVVNNLKVATAKIG